MTSRIPMYIGFLTYLYKPIETNILGGKSGAAVPLPRRTKVTETHITMQIPTATRSIEKISMGPTGGKANPEVP
jgi:hypothetical protein